MLSIEVYGTPIGGEDAREASWVEQISQAGQLCDVKLGFQIEHGRKVDLDNLVRPAMRGCKKQGFILADFLNYVRSRLQKCSNQNRD